MNTVKPYSPSDVRKNSRLVLPDEVFEAVNELLCKNLNGKYAGFQQCEVISLIMEKYNQNHPDSPVTRQEIFAKQWLNFEMAYRQMGWKVTYDKPGYNETYEPSFEFESEE